LDFACGRELKILRISGQHFPTFCTFCQILARKRLPWEIFSFFVNSIFHSHYKCDKWSQEEKQQKSKQEKKKHQKWEGEFFGLSQNFFWHSHPRVRNHSRFQFPLGSEAAAAAHAFMQQSGPCGRVYFLHQNLSSVPGPTAIKLCQKEAE
jgi:hypothetical protein